MKKAMITGGSDGIGLAVAQLLAREGYQLTLVARNGEKLDRAVASLAGEGHRSQTADLSKKDDVHAVAGLFTREHHDLLVNSAGVGTYGRFEDLPLGEQVQMMQLNMTGLTALCHDFIRQAREGDALVNVASTLASTSFPGLAVYSATKAFVLNFSESLWWENKKKGVYVLGFCPGVTATRFHKTKGDAHTLFPAFIIQTPEAVAREMVAAIKARKKPRVVSGTVNRSMLFFQRFMTRKGIVNMMGRFSPA